MLLKRLAEAPDPLAFLFWPGALGSQGSLGGASAGEPQDCNPRGASCGLMLSLGLCRGTSKMYPWLETCLGTRVSAIVCSSPVSGVGTLVACGVKRRTMRSQQFAASTV